jgi:hypothetical protein
VGSDPWAVCNRLQDCGEQGGDSAARGTTTAPVRKTLTFIMRYTLSRFGVSRRFGGFVGAVVDYQEIWKQENRSAARTPVEEYMRLASVSVRTARYHIQKGIVETILAPDWHWHVQKSKIAANDIVEATR